MGRVVVLQSDLSRLISDGAFFWFYLINLLLYKLGFAPVTKLSRGMALGPELGVHVCVTQPDLRAFLRVLFSQNHWDGQIQEAKIKWPLQFFKGAICRILCNLLTVVLKQN